jgi:hypothetical protein
MSDAGLVDTRIQVTELTGFLGAGKTTNKGGLQLLFRIKRSFRRNKSDSGLIFDE